MEQHEVYFVRNRGNGSLDLYNQDIKPVRDGLFWWKSGDGWGTKPFEMPACWLRDTQDCDTPKKYRITIEEIG